VIILHTCKCATTNCSLVWHFRSSHQCCSGFKSSEKLCQNDLPVNKA